MVTTESKTPPSRIMIGLHRAEHSRVESFAAVPSLSGRVAIAWTSSSWQIHFTHFKSCSSLILSILELAGATLMWILNLDAQVADTQFIQSSDNIFAGQFYPQALNPPSINYHHIPKPEFILCSFFSGGTECEDCERQIRVICKNIVQNQDLKYCFHFLTRIHTENYTPGTYHIL